LAPRRAAPRRNRNRNRNGHRNEPLDGLLKPAARRLGMIVPCSEIAWAIC
jgi:hypothetical protein